MNQFFTLVFVLFILITAQAQQQNKSQISPEYVITATHTSSTSGITHTYTRQTIDGIEIFGTESSYHISSNGASIKEQLNYIKGIEYFAQNKSTSLTPSQAIASVAQQMGYGQVRNQQVVQVEDSSKKTIFSNSGISKRAIPVKLGYLYSKADGLQAIYELSVYQNDAQHWYNFFVDANSGSIITKVDWMTSCAMLGDNHEDHNHSSVAAISEEKIVKYAVNPVNNSMMVGSYNVYPMPVESPNHGGRSIVSNPENLDASPFGWHDTNGVAGAEFTTTRGNNTNTYEDGDNQGFSPNGGAALSFDFPINTIYTNANQSESAVITNLFYWTNIMHDVMYVHGFDEPSGNFQETNYKGLGGIGGDSVLAEAQDGSGTCNANFGTPPDGNDPIMQMFICGSRDGDLDNPVIAHEYGHGISTRLTGGAANSGCLGNEEQMGEGWSDFFGLILTIEPGDLGTDSRGMGTWLVGQNASGPGIRSQPYDTDTNTYTYDSIKNEVAPHGVGAVWSMMLWEMTWALIDEHGVDNDIYNFNGTLNDGGNVMALALVMEGLKLQPCSPGFVDGRDAILAADQAIYGGANECLIWEAFAIRGLGFSAQQGSTANKNDGTQAFDVPPIAFDITDASFCDTEAAVTLDGGRVGGGIYSGPGVTDDANGATFTFDPDTAGIGEHIITYTAQDCNGITGSSTDTISVTANNPQPFCQPVTITLNAAGVASINNTDVVTNLAPDTTIYTVDQTGTFNPESTFGSTTVSLGEDEGSAPISIGFNFEFFGNTYSNLILQSNGFISFDGSGVTGSASWTPVTLPVSGAPNNKIAFLWDDYSPQEIPNSVTYKVIGTAPNRKFVVNYTDIPLFSNQGINPDRVTTQVQLFESSYRIEVHTTSTAGANNRTQGIENVDGTQAIVVPGRNGGSWNVTNDFVAFEPGVTNTLARSCGNDITLSLSQSLFSCKDIGENLITVTADDGNGVTATCQTTVTVIGEETRYTGSWDNGLPDPSKKAVFSSNYSTATADITACSCEIEPTATVIVEAGSFMNIEGTIKVDGTLLVNHQGSVVQVDDDAITINNGTIDVAITTPMLEAREFLILGSPMDTENEAVFNGAFQVLNHNTDNYTMFTSQAIDGINFYDEGADELATQVGTLKAGEGYIVRPSYTQDGTYDYSFDNGTLNSGDITYLAGFNVNKNDSANLLANPYPSAIDADLFLAQNSGIISEIYFWEHLTPPGVMNGPYGEQNFSMEDISIYNNMGGAAAAANGGGIPNNIISTAQGFGIKANTGGTVTFTNAMRVTSGNTTLRSTLTDANRLWLSISETKSNNGSSNLIGFTSAATALLDYGFDTEKIGTLVSLYTHLEDGTERLSIQARESFDSSMQIPMGFSSIYDEELTYTISILNMEGDLISNANVYIIDNLTGTIANLNENNYDFTSGGGTYDNRFTIVFENNPLSTNDFDLSSITMYPNPGYDTVTISSTNSVMTNIEVRDIRGRIVINQAVASQNNASINIASLNSAIYLVKITTDTGFVNKRLIKN